ncbi:MAG: hypothetical protein EAZ19_01075 [Oscillatoriales cyanobacterium]|nr:MAG: hypothetical protein EAZ59_22950 [Oscillatoriales cyanobacterium]TAF91554.1 MAG: hypothetical protein EAZ49_04875 [Oscillatoriales cyanobacterium]TAG57410.1 MAG: hypothetical protein EAZ28_17805 [Oscillatoriales cyanobacterium]TAG71318.1 MAG: hypothetical protein EAZ23_19000 [Oscillatoriales cyanobacterium]TAG99183.1 MAG: hypothetical protein EAZ19_01075 [Oscillatoriales cyanobacterium]
MLLSTNSVILEISINSPGCKSGQKPGFLPKRFGCIWRKTNMFVGAKHDRSQYGIITNNLYAVMLRPPQKPDAPKDFLPTLRLNKKPGFFGLDT